MKTITFYSYKGGVGRSLALVNIATRLSEFGKKVCVIDFDLEAPGLHIKFPISNTIKKGIVDYVYEFSENGIIAEKITDYSIGFKVLSNCEVINLIPAGNIKQPEYWKRLSSINWYNLIYENDEIVEFFLNLKKQIKNELNPDFLLIDSRTGISEMSGVTLSLLADEIVILAANNKENLEGSARIIEALNRPENLLLGESPKLNFVLTRVPFTNSPEDKLKEKQLVNRINRIYLEPHLKEISVIHSDRELEENEKIKIAVEEDDTENQTSLDYLKLFEKLIHKYLTDNEINKFQNIKKSEILLKKALLSKKLDTKLDLLLKAKNLNDLNTDIKLNLAHTYYALANYRAAIKIIDEILMLNKNNISAIEVLIICLMRLDKFEEALKYIENIIELDSDNYLALCNRIIIMSKMGNYIKSEEFSSELINLEPELSSGYALRSDARRNLKKLKLALEDAYKALEIDSNDLHAVATLGEIYAEMGRINEFYIQFENALKMDSTVMRQVVLEEAIYKRFYNDERFNNLISKYNVFLDDILDT